MKKEWLFTTVILLVTLAAALGLLRWLAPGLLGVPADLQMVQTSKKVPPFFDIEEIRHEVEESYKCPVTAVIPYTQELMALSSTSIFALHYPEHFLTKKFEASAAYLAEE